MSDSYTVMHGGLAEANNTLNSCVQRAGQIISNLDASLARMAQATQGRATPLWAEQQRIWDAKYSDMVTRLSGGHLASVNAAEDFQFGDNQGARIFGG